MNSTRTPARGVMLCIFALLMTASLAYDKCHTENGKTIKNRKRCEKRSDEGCVVVEKPNKSFQNCACCGQARTDARHNDVTCLMCNHGLAKADICAQHHTAAVKITGCDPTSTPTEAPTTVPTAAPTTPSPTAFPTTAWPTVSPTASPTVSPTTAAPTTKPTTAPTFSPTMSTEQKFDFLFKEIARVEQVAKAEKEARLNLEATYALDYKRFNVQMDRANYMLDVAYPSYLLALQAEFEYPSGNTTRARDPFVRMSEVKQLFLSQDAAKKTYLSQQAANTTYLEMNVADDTFFKKSVFSNPFNLTAITTHTVNTEMGSTILPSWRTHFCVIDSVRIGTVQDVLLFEITSAIPSTYSNTYAYWWQAGGVVSSGAGKRAAYDDTLISEIKFVMSTGAEARYDLGKCDTMVNIMSAFGLSPSSNNNDSNTWKTGHGSFSLISTTDTGYFQTQAVTIGQGDGSVDSKDWAVFGFDSNPAGDWQSDSAIGCEDTTSICGGAHTAKIYGKPCGNQYGGCSIERENQHYNDPWVFYAKKTSSIDKTNCRATCYRFA